MSIVPAMMRCYARPFVLFLELRHGHDHLNSEHSTMKPKPERMSRNGLVSAQNHHSRPSDQSCIDPSARCNVECAPTSPSDASKLVMTMDFPTNNAALPTLAIHKSPSQMSDVPVLSLVVLYECLRPGNC